MRNDFEDGAIIDDVEYGIESTLTEENMLRCLLLAVEESVGTYFINDKIDIELTTTNKPSSDNPVIDGSLSVDVRVPKRFKHIENGKGVGSLDSIKFKINVNAYYYHKGIYSSKPMLVITGIDSINIDYVTFMDGYQKQCKYSTNADAISKSIVHEPYDYLLTTDFIGKLTHILSKYLTDKQVYLYSFKSKFSLAV